MWEFVDKIIYINLDHRTDRHASMEKFFNEGQIPSEKVVRFPAIYYRSYPTKGCLASHTKVLELAKTNGWGNILILEDDLEWTNFDSGYKQLEELTKISGWDVIKIIGWYIKYDFPRIYSSRNAGGYLVNASYIDVLLKSRSDELNKFKQTLWFSPPKVLTSGPDYHWDKLMRKDNWYGVYPCMCRQMDGYSDLGGRKVESSKIVGIFDKKIHSEVYKGANENVLNV